MARLCQPGGKANEGAGGARERRVFPGLKTAKIFEIWRRIHVVLLQTATEITSAYG